jgi:hypothetical protein
MDFIEVTDSYKRNFRFNKKYILAVKTEGYKLREYEGLSQEYHKLMSKYKKDLDEYKEKYNLWSYAANSISVENMRTRFWRRRKIPLPPVKPIKPEHVFEIKTRREMIIVVILSKKGSDGYVEERLYFHEPLECKNLKEKQQEIMDKF